MYFACRLIKRLLIGGWMGFLAYLLAIVVITYLPMHTDFKWLKEFKDIDHQIGIVIAMLIFWWYWKVTKYTDQG